MISDFESPRTFEVSTLGWAENLRCVPGTFRNYAELAVDLHSRYGFVYRQALPDRLIAFAHPRHLHRMLKSHATNYPKSGDYEILHPVLGDGIFVSDGELWTRQRRLLAPEFRSAVVARFLPVICRCVGSLFDEWDAEAERDFTGDMMRLTVWIVGESLFHQDFRAESEQIGHALEVCLAQATLQMMSMGLLQPWMPTPGNLASRREEATLNRIVRGLIEHHRQHPGPGMLSRILSAKDEETGEGMTDQQVVDEVKSLILAGHETTSLALSWTFYLLSSHPEVERRLQEESDRVLGGREPTPDDLAHLEYTRMVFLETMRLYPPVPTVTRTAREADTFDGVHVAAGEKMVLNIYAAHRHPELWPDPDVFDPERFSPSRADGIQAFSYLPFLLGRRACLGEHFAMVEGIAALAMIAGRYAVERTEREPIPTRPISTLRLSRPMRVRVRRRTG